MDKKRLGYILLTIVGISAVIYLILTSPIRQSEAYHSFSDTFEIGGIPNFWNVISNLPFLMVGLFGIFQLKKSEEFNFQLLIFFLGVLLVAFGSGYYHYFPNSSTLVWDRLPMTIAFTALISIVISEFIDISKGKKLLLPLLFIGVISILYWVKFDDLRLYAFVQFYPIIAIPIILVLFKSDKNSPKGFWVLLIAYAIAKLFEFFDFEIHDKLQILSGHSLKHLIASIGVFGFAKIHFRQRN